MRYNPNAQRGINSLSIQDAYLLLANCSVGSNDKNLWLYKVTDNQFVPLDAINLVKDTSLKQVFDFSTQFTRFEGSLYFLASTEEGLVWLGRVRNDKLETLNNLKLVDEGRACARDRSRFRRCIGCGLQYRPADALKERDAGGRSEQGNGAALTTAAGT